MTDAFGRTISTNSFVIFPRAQIHKAIRVGLVVSDRPEQSKARILSVVPRAIVNGPLRVTRVWAEPETCIVVSEDLLPKTTTQALWDALTKENEQMYMEKQIQDEIGQY